MDMSYRRAQVEPCGQESAGSGVQVFTHPPSKQAVPSPAQAPFPANLSFAVAVIREAEAGVTASHRRQHSAKDRGADQDERSLSPAHELHGSQDHARSEPLAAPGASSTLRLVGGISRRSGCMK